MSRAISVESERLSTSSKLSPWAFISHTPYLGLVRGPLEVLRTSFVVFILFAPELAIGATFSSVVGLRRRTCQNEERDEWNAEVPLHVAFGTPKADMQGIEGGW